ncbi:acyltransferase family protein [Niallia sp. Krafla_26]|uniref:acyltransferase family protein n=1 Tax=Niallia sp. Krafla_26 TaxID=3064703 RepID=UPI003D16F971
MLYTLISFFLIIVILFIFSWFNKDKTVQVNGFSHLSKKHTDILKGIATVLIVISHIANYRGFSILIPLGGIGVALFLLGSGYGLNESFKRKGLDNFFKNRLLKIMIPYWIMVIFYWVLNFETISLNSFLGSLILVNRLPFMWFIQYIFIWYLIFYLSKKIFNGSKGTLFLLIMGLILVFIFKDTTWGEQSFSFTVGVLLSQYQKLKNYLSVNTYQSSLVFLLLGIIFSGLFFMMKIKGLDTINNYWVMSIIQTLMKVSLSIFIIQFTYCFKNYLYTALVTVGLYSFEIYLSHTLIIEMTRSDNQYYLLIVFFIVVIALSVGINKLSSMVYKMLFKKTSISTTS